VPVLFEPLVASVPLQLPEAVQVDAFVVLQLSVALPPLEMLAGDALKVTVGAGELTLTVTDCEALPPAPVHVSKNLVVAVSAAVLLEPRVGSVPDQPPDAAQLLALVVDQVSVDRPPLATVIGLALNVMAGAGGFTLTTVDCAALPPAPLQVRVYVLLALSAPVDCVPDVALVPDHLPEAVQEVALAELQVRVALAPLAMVLGLALRVTVGEAALTDTVTDWDAVPPVPVQASV
jgi:hypothetical protein